jgi:hypothetical protein
VRQSYQLKDKKNLEMNDDTYALRRKVIDLVYEANGLLATRLPRVVVRITEDTIKCENWLGRARLGKNILWIPRNIITQMKDDELRHIVFHEIIHAVFSEAHDEAVPLMRAIVNKTTREEQNEQFVAYAVKHGYELK